MKKVRVIRENATIHAVVPLRVRSRRFLVLSGMFLFAFPFFFLSCLPAFAQGWATKPPPLSSVDPSAGKVRLLEDVGIDQRLGEQLPLDLVFRDETGSPVRLGDYFG